ncbi:yhhN-like family protein [Clostridium sp. CAG:1024]|nr:yhhN-like family protein [Clostridium sp. CAG:1024]
MKTNVILFLFLIAAGAQLFACVPPMRARLRYATKLLLMPLLALWLLFATNPTPHAITLGLLCGFLGDLLLLAAAKKSFFFVVGSSFFAAGHALYAVYFLTHLGAAPRFGLIAFGALLYALYIALLLRRLRKGEIGGKMQVLAASYLAVISFMSLCAFLFAVTNGSIWHWMVFAASLLFLFSDSVLAYDKYYKKLKFRYLIVMSTYILAQAGITFGVYLTLGGH